MIPFGEFAPDIADKNQNVATVADNVIAGDNGYTPLVGLSTAQYGIGGAAPKSAFAWVPGDTIEYVIAYVTVGATYVNGNNFAGGSTTQYTAYQYGYPYVVWDDDLIIAGAGSTPKIITSSDLATLGTNKSADLGGSPPIAYTCARVRDFLVLGRVYDGGTDYRDRVQWCAFNDPTSWTIGTNQADRQDLINGGDVTRIVGGEYGIIFQRNAITRMTYIGTPAIFQFDVIEAGRGTLSGQSVVQDGEDIYYYGMDGFYVLKNGTQSIPIGREKVDKWFNSRVHGPNIYSTSNSEKGIMGAKDNATGCIYWSYQMGDEANNFIRGYIVIYNPKTDKWSTATIASAAIFSILPKWDNDRLQENAIGFYTYSGSAYEYQYFTDSATTYAATVETGEIFDEGYRTQLNSVRPVVDGTCTVTVKTRNLLTASKTSSSATALDTTGKATFRTNNRYHQISVTTSGDFNHAVGVEVDTKRRGKR